MKTFTVNRLGSGSAFHLRMLKKTLNPGQDQAQHALSGAETLNTWSYPKRRIFLSLRYCSVKLFGITVT